MDIPWVQSIVIGAVVGLAYSIIPMLAEYSRMMRLVLYINMDRVQFQQLLATGGPEALAFPLSRKLTEKGILLAWKTQRDLERLRVVCEGGGYGVNSAVFEPLKTSLESYIESAGMMTDRIGVIAWHPGDEFGADVPEFVAAKFAAINRDWAEFRRQSAFLERFVRRNAGIPTGSV